jgi:hypothetical protein
METLHGSLGAALLQGINNLLFEDTPVVEGFNPEEVDQREEFFDLVLTAAEISNMGTLSSIQNLHGSASEAPTVVASELEASFRTFG